MKISDIEIPQPNERKGIYRFFEILPAVLSYTVVIIPIVLSLIDPALAAYYLVAFVLVWFAKASAVSVRVLQGYSRVKKARRLDWGKLLEDLEDPSVSIIDYKTETNSMLKIHRANLDHMVERGDTDPLKPSEIIHVIIHATYNETQDIIHPTVDDILKSQAVDLKNNVAYFLAYEERTGEQKKLESEETVALYSKNFMHAEAIAHKLLPGEITGKGGNATWAARRVAEWAAEHKIDASRVMITVLDADNRPDPNYFAAVSYSYIAAAERKHKSFQPIAMYTNNIWDVPAIMRISAVNNSFFHTANAMRLHALRNFSAHSQSLDALIDSNYWSVRTIVEDGHQFWRMYFAYDGEHEVIPIYAPIYQDAVLASTYKTTLIAQFKQIRRWTWGSSDIAYVATRAFFMKNKIPLHDRVFKFLRLLENHVSWASSSLLLVVAGWLPYLVNSQRNEDIVALQLPNVMARINLVGLIVIFITIYIGFAILPPRPKHYKRTKFITFVLQWTLIPIVGVVFNSFAAYYSQTRLALGKYFEGFNVTEKAVKRHSD